MESLTNDELLIEIERRKETINKRKSIEVSAAAEKRLKLLQELNDLDDEIGDSSAPSSSISSSATSSSIPIVDISVAVTAAAPKPKNSMLSYWTAAVIDVEAVDRRRIADAKENSESKESGQSRERIVAVGKEQSRKEARPCSASVFSGLKRQLKGDDLILIEYQIDLKRIWCSGCGCPVRNDNLAVHVNTPKHVTKAKTAIETKLRQASLVTAISESKNLSRNVLNETHLFRCDLVRTLLCSATAIQKADDFRDFLLRWTKTEMTDSSNLLRTYLPIIKVKDHNKTFYTPSIISNLNRNTHI